MRALWANDASDVWIVGARLNTFHRVDGRWTFVPTAIHRELFGVWGSSRSNAWAVGEGGALAHWNGTAWMLFSHGDREHWDAVWGSGEEDVWVASDDATMRWNGNVWKVVGNGATAGWSNSPGDAWIAAHDGLRHWDGASLSPARAVPHPIRAISGRAASDFWAAGDDATLLHWTGSTWQTVPVPGSGRLTALSIPRVGEVWVGGDDGFVGRWDGQKWTRHDADRNDVILAIRSSDAGAIWVLTAEGPAWQIGRRKILRWNDTHWSSIPIPTPAWKYSFLRDLWPLGASLVAASSAGFEKWDGHAWHAIPFGAPDGFMVLWGDAHTLWGASASGAVLSIDRDGLAGPQ